MGKKLNVAWSVESVAEGWDIIDWLSVSIIKEGKQLPSENKIVAIAFCKHTLFVISALLAQGRSRFFSG